MDSSESPVYGEQEQSAYNGYFGSVCDHPLFLFNSQGDCLVAKLRPGNVHSADGWEEVLLPEIERQRQNGKEVVFRADAAFAKPEIYEALEERGVKYAVRLPANENLERDIEELLTRPVRTSEPRAGGALQGFSLPGGQLVDGTSSSGEGRVSRRGAISPCGLHRHQRGASQPGGRAVL